MLMKYLVKQILPLETIKRMGMPLDVGSGGEFFNLRQFPPRIHQDLPVPSFLQFSSFFLPPLLTPATTAVVPFRRVSEKYKRYPGCS